MKIGVVKCPHCGAEWTGAISDGSDRLLDENGDLFVSLGPQEWGRIATASHKVDERGNYMVRMADGSWGIIGRRG